ncbi:hypothetical protein OIU77_000563 [Salix suchowensis]|uniref:Uncharacterized protein n=2 Tax=Salix TaxID=40685 RepID=A0A9Q0VI61_SALPP|nr:hypothetical protein OIU77_000563 [Salix suchowensis]KAJ6387070.1 hypothetical protein OIU78_016902 [Salix suchowensis]KAJ6749109.1 hypothetical protein OIU79_030081 [Salix purpurea]
MPSSASMPFSLSLHHRHHYPLNTSTTSSHHDSFISRHQLHIPKPEREKAKEEEEEEDEEEEKESKKKKRFPLLRKTNQLPFN